MTTELAERANTMPAVESEPRPGSMLAIIARAASDPNVDVAKMQALLDMQRQIMAEQARAEFSVAFTRLAGNLPRVKKNGTVDLVNKDGKNLGSYAFAKWEDIDRVIRPLLAEEGFGLSFNSRSRGADGGGLIVSGTLMHRDGHSITAEMPLPLDTGAGRNNLQATGSTLSYGKRYVAEMLLNIVREGEDDDGVRGGMEFIDAHAVKQLDDLLRKTNSNFDAFCEIMEVRGLPDIQVKDYPRAVNAVLSKMVRQQETG